MEKRVRVVVVVVAVVAAEAAGAVGAEEKEKEEDGREESGDGKPDDVGDDDDGGWKDESSATATAVGLGATPVLLLPLVDADIAIIWCGEGTGSECVMLGPPPDTDPPPWPSTPPPSLVVARLHAASVAASIETRVASACAGETARSSRRRDPRSSSPIESESQLSQGAGRDIAARVSEKKERKVSLVEEAS